MGLERQTRENPQAGLFGDDLEAWREHWWGMPSYVMGDAQPLYKVVVNCFTIDDLMEFGRRLDLPVTPRTNTLNFPPDNLDKPDQWLYTDE